VNASAHERFEMFKHRECLLTTVELQPAVECVICWDDGRVVGHAAGGEAKVVENVKSLR
jgi:ribosomal protein S27E